MPRLSKIGAAALAAFGWTSGSSVTASYLVVAGGGGGGADSSYGGGGWKGGGGGAGGYRTSTATLNPTLTYTVTVGSGGTGGASISANGSVGNDSVFNSITSTGGGYGAGSPGTSTTAGGNGGSGGGASGGFSGSSSGGSGNTPSTSPSQGNNGGGSGYAVAGGGGGSSGSGSSSVGSGGGGAGTANSISGSSVTYAAGGAVGGSVGTANTGNGGGSGNSLATYPGLNGGSGIVIISYAGAQQFGGGVVTSVGGNTIHTFTTSGTLSPLSSLTASYLVVAGGGSGGYDTAGNAGGGGAGGLLTGTGLTLDANSIYTVTVGAGGTAPTAANSVGNDGSNSAFSLVATTAVGGGGGGTYSNFNGRSGGSGGGGGQTSGAGGAGTSGQGNAGGTNSGIAGSGGGGAGAVGVSSSTALGGNGGAGSASSISGTSTNYAGGGGGSNHGSAGSQGGLGGTGGGGNGHYGATAGQAGTANTGGGGGGGGETRAAGNGGSGVVIISYAGATQQMAGGTVTIVGGNVIHTFTSSGYLTPIKYVNNSLRFRSSASAYLTRTPSVAGNRTTFTISTWIKRGNLTARQGIIAAGTGNSGSLPGGSIYFDSSTSTLSLIGAGGTSYQLATTQVFRDPAAWYHLVFVFDTTQATSSNRIKVYLNGVQITSFGTATYPSQNFATDYNNTAQQNIGARTDDGGTGNASTFFDGYMAEVNMVDGQALTPNSFGTINSYGVWQPITYGGSYGTNGFYLPFNSQAVSYVGSFTTSQYLSVANNSAFQFGTGDFTVECYFNPTTLTGTPGNSQSIVGLWGGSTGQASWLLYLSSGNLIWYTSTNGSAQTNSLSGASGMVIGKWYHLALVRSSGTTSIYVNGSLIASTSSVVNLFNANSTLTIGYNPIGGTPDYVNGYLSNVRIVKGTALYTANFIPPTSALTNVSGTSLLTLQNSSIVDNSSNAFSITNTGGISTGQTYPFAYGIFNDQGPAGNNWTPNNISGAFGSTLDYMTDVPTLTSASVANYCTLNPLDAGTNLTFSNGNLQISSSSNPQNSTRGTIGATSGKFYWEAVVTSGSPGCVVGIAGPTFSISSNFSGQMYGYDSNGQKIINGSSSAYGSSWSANDVIGIAFDLDALTITFYKNNTSQGTITGITAGITWQPFMHANSVTAVANFGQRPFTYTPPSGYVALNTYNL